MLFVVLMATNFVLARTCFPEPPSITIPYTFFKQQVEADNVASVTGLGDEIRGAFRNDVTYPPVEAGKPPPAAPTWLTPDAGPRTSKHFQTRRPAFADPGLETLLETKGVVINARPTRAARRWFSLLLGFGPTLLLIGAFVWLSRRAAASGRRRLFGLGRSRAKRYSEERAEGHLRRRGRHRRGRGRAGRDRRLPQEPREVPAARRHASRRACCWSARPAPARRCWPAPSPARPACRSSA